MAHGLEKSNDMAYVGQVPWHGLGVELPGLATIAEVLEAVPSLAARVNKEQVTRNGVDVEGKFFTVREDTDQVLGIVGSKYTVLQNEDAFRFFDALTQDPNGPKYETAGVLWGGKKVWMLAKLPEFIEVVPGDIVEPYILLSNSHDASSAVQILETPIRVVCQNTLNAATRGTKGRRFNIRHSGNLLSKVADVQDALGIIRADFEATGELYRQLANVEPTKEQIDQVFDQLFPATESKRSELQRDRVLSLASHGRGNAPVAGTAWGLYNGITELVDHVNNQGSRRDDAMDMRLNNIWFGSGADFKADALEAITNAVLVN